MIRQPPCLNRPYPPFPYTPHFRSFGRTAETQLLPRKPEFAHGVADARVIVLSAATGWNIEYRPNRLGADLAILFADGGGQRRDEGVLYPTGVLLLLGRGP